MQNSCCLNKSAYADSFLSIPDTFRIRELFTKIILDMRKESGFSMLEQAIELVPEFKMCSANWIK
jgi:hypothetical protein